MRVISKKSLREFWEKHTGAKAALQAWYEDALRSDWRTPGQIKASYANASVLPTREPDGGQVKGAATGNSHGVDCRWV